MKHKEYSRVHRALNQSRSVDHERRVADGIYSRLDRSLGKHGNTHAKTGTDPITRLLDEATIGLTTRGDMVYMGASDLGRLAIGAANAIMKSDGTDPGWLTLSAQTVVGMLTGGSVAAIAIGIADNNMVQIDGSPSDDEYARFTAAGLEGRTAGEAKTDLGFMTDLVDDTTPQLGGTLDVNEKAIADGDGDTKVELEESTDSDEIAFTVAGTQAMRIHNSAIVDFDLQSCAIVAKTSQASWQYLDDSAWRPIILETASTDNQSEMNVELVSGTATATTANKLVDSGQFTEAESYYLGMKLFNSTDNTYAVVTAKDDNDTLSIDTDIMANGETYVIFHSKFTATEDGLYVIGAYVALSSLGDGVRAFAGLHVNGAFYSLFTPVTPLGAAANAQPGGVLFVNLTAGDYVHLIAYHEHGSVRQSKGAKINIYKVA